MNLRILVFIGSFFLSTFSHSSVVYEQSMNTSDNFYYADLNYYFLYDNFSINENGYISEISVMGMFWSDNAPYPSDTSFAFSLHEDIPITEWGIQPDRWDSPFFQIDTAAKSVIDTGLTYTGTDYVVGEERTANIYELTFELGEQVHLSGDTVYWLGMSAQTNITNNLTNRFAVMNSNDGDGIRYSNFLEIYPDSAFTLHGGISPVPVPASAWLFGSALIGLAGIKRKK